MEKSFRIQFSFRIKTKQIDQQWVISWILRGSPPPFSYDLCPYFISSRTILIHSTAVRRHVKRNFRVPWGSYEVLSLGLSVPIYKMSKFLRCLYD